MQFTQLLAQIGQTSLTALLSIVVLFILAKLMGTKQVSQMTMFDYVVGISRAAHRMGQAVVTTV